MRRSDYRLWEVEYGLTIEDRNNIADVKAHREPVAGTSDRIDAT
jgi:hypothetical protein